MSITLPLGFSATSSALAYTALLVVKMSPFFALASCFAMGPNSKRMSTMEIIMTMVRSA